MLVSFLFLSTSFLCLVRHWQSLSVVFTRWVPLFFLSDRSPSVLILSCSVSGFSRVGSFHPSSPCLLWSPVPFTSGPPVRIFSFFSALPRVLCLLFSTSGSSLRLLFPALGSGRCVLLWISLHSSCRVAILRAVSLVVFLLCLFFFLCSLLWPGLCRWFSSVSCLSSSVLSRR